MKYSKHSPLKSKPLRYAGKSLDERINKLINEDLASYLLFCTYVIMMAGYEWWRYYKHNPPSPKIISAFALFVVVISAFKIKKIISEVKSLKLGREGERAVGEYIDSFREEGHKVFHDIVGDNFNIDHVIISEKGIYVIETKTYSKPKNPDAKIYFDGNSIKIDGMTLNKNLLHQVKASTQWLLGILEESTGKRYPIRSVILFPGWFVQAVGNASKSKVWVLNPKAFKKYLQNESQKITTEDMHLAFSHLIRYIRSKELELEKSYKYK